VKSVAVRAPSLQATPFLPAKLPSAVLPSAVLPSAVLLAAVLLSAVLLFALPARAEEAPSFASALELARDGQLTQARVAAQAVLAGDPANADAARLLQDVLLAMGKTDEARAAIPQAAPDLIKRGLTARLLAGAAACPELAAVVKDPGAPKRFLLDLAAAQIAAGHDAAAESSANTFVKNHADDGEGLTVLGEVLAARRKNTGARKAFEQALAQVPGLARPAAGLAALHAQAGHEKKSRAVLQDALAVHPHHPTLLRALADDQARAGEYDEAVRTLGQVLGMPVPKADVHARLGEVHRARRDYPKAEASAKAALALEKDHPGALRTRGFVKQKRKDLVGALADYESVAKLRPTWAQIHVDIAFIHFLNDKVVPAQRAIDVALKLDKKLPDAHLKAGLILFARGKGKLAKKSLGVVLKADRENVPANRAMGYILLDEGKPKNAIKHFRVVADQNETDSASMRMIGRCLLVMGKVDDAIESFREAVSRNDKDAFAYFDLGKGLEKLEKWDDAAAAYRRAITAEATLVHPHLYLARLLDEVLDEPEESLPHYKRFLELGGDDEGGSIKKRVEALEDK